MGTWGEEDPATTWKVGVHLVAEGWSEGPEISKTKHARYQVGEVGLVRVEVTRRRAGEVARGSWKQWTREWLARNLEPQLEPNLEVEN